MFKVLTASNNLRDMINQVVIRVIDYSYCLELGGEVFAKHKNFTPDFNIFRYYDALINDIILLLEISDIQEGYKLFVLTSIISKCFYGTKHVADNYIELPYKKQIEYNKNITDSIIKLIHQYEGVL